VRTLRFLLFVSFCIAVWWGLKFLFADEITAITGVGSSDEDGAQSLVRKEEVFDDLGRFARWRQFSRGRARKVTPPRLIRYWAALRRRCWRALLAFAACTELLLCLNQPPPAGQLYAGIPLGGIFFGRWGAAHLGTFGGIFGTAIGVMLGCTGGLIVGSVMAPASSELASRCFGGTKAAKWVGYLPVAMLPAVGLLVEFYRLW